MKKLFFSETFIVLLLSTAILFLSFLSLFYNISITPKGTVFPLFHNNGEDYNLYLQYMRQSFDGNWLVTSRYTPEEFPRRFVYQTYILLGKMARLSGVSLPVTYNLSRLIFGAVFIFLIYKLIRLFFPGPFSKNKRLLALFLTLFAPPFLQIAKTPTGFAVTRFLSFWTEIDGLARLAYIPHHLLSKVLMLATLIFLYESIEKKNLKWLSLASIAGFISGVSSPFVLLNLQLLVVIFLLLTPFLLYRSKNNQNVIFSYCLFYLLFSSTSLLYLRWVENSGFPWNHYLEREKMVFPVFLSDFVYSLGPHLLASIIAIALNLKRKNLLSVLLTAWILEPFIGIFLLSPFIPVQNVRFLAGAYFIPLGIMAAQGYLIVAKLSNTLFKRMFYTMSKAGDAKEGPPQHGRSESEGVLGGGIMSGRTRGTKLILVFLLFPSIILFALDAKTNFEEQIRYFRPWLYNIYVPREVFAAFSFLNEKTPVESVVLAQAYMSNLLPAHTHNRTVIGHHTNTYNIVEKESAIARFFDQKDGFSARETLVRYRVSYVFFGPDTPPPQEEFLAKIGLKRVFQNSLVSIYKR